MITWYIAKSGIKFTETAALSETGAWNTLQNMFPPLKQYSIKQLRKQGYTSKKERT